jgi:hypothetical protein
MPIGFLWRFGLEANIDEIPGLQHLLRRLGEARLVAVHRLERAEAGQEGGERQQRQEDAGAQMAGRRSLDQPLDRGGERNHSRSSRPPGTRK